MQFAPYFCPSIWPFGKNHLPAVAVAVARRRKEKNRAGPGAKFSPVLFSLLSSPSFSFTCICRRRHIHKVQQMQKQKQQQGREKKEKRKREKEKKVQTCCKEWTVGQLHTLSYTCTLHPLVHFLFFFFFPSLFFPFVSLITTQLTYLLTHASTKLTLRVKSNCIYLQRREKNTHILNLYTYNPKRKKKNCFFALCTYKMKIYLFILTQLITPFAVKVILLHAYKFTYINHYVHVE